MDFNNIIKNNFLYRYENNELKTKKLIITPFMHIKDKTFNDIVFRPNLIADVLAKFYRQQNVNVMVTANVNNLNDDYIINSKIEYNELNDNILFNHLNIIDKLNINYDYNKSIHLLDNEVIKLYQNLFIFLYNNNLIKYEKRDLYYDSSYTNVYDKFSTDNYYNVRNEYGLFLDISKYVDKIITNIDNLLIEDNLKELFKSVLDEEYEYKVHLKTPNDIDITVRLDEPYMLGSLACVLVGVNTLDILEYINPNQISYLEGYFKTKSINYFDTKNYVTNPLTGKKVPLFIAKDIKGFRGLYQNDKELINKLGLDVINILSSDNTLINSDYLDGLTISKANMQLYDDFIAEDIITFNKKYNNTKILLSSNYHYGIISPIMIEENKMFLLSNKLPIYYDNKFNLNISGNFKVYPKPLNNSFISLFNFIINIIYDKDREFNKNINIDILDNIKKLLNNSLVIYNDGNEKEEILLPVIMMTILEDIFNIKLLDRIEFLPVAASFDNYGFTFKEDNNNLINYEQLITLYNSDSIRLYLLSTNSCDKLYFYKDNIFKFKQILYDLEMIVNNVSDYNPILDINSIRFKQTILECLLSYSFSDIIEHITNYIKFLRSNKPSKQQLLELIVILSLFIPDITNRINNINYKNKIDLLSINWSKEV